MTGMNFNFLTKRDRRSDVNSGSRIGQPHIKSAIPIFKSRCVKGRQRNPWSAERIRICQGSAGFQPAALGILPNVLSRGPGRVIEECLARCQTLPAGCRRSPPIFGPGKTTEKLTNKLSINGLTTNGRQIDSIRFQSRLKNRNEERSPSRRLKPLICRI